MTRRATIALLAPLFALAACGVGDNQGESSPTPTPAVASSTPTPSQTPAAPKLTVVKIGEPAVTPSATITVLSVEPVESISTEFDFEPPITPPEGGTSWLLKMNWTNLTNDAVQKVCWGPDMVKLHVYDTQDREMLLDDRSGMVPGNDCTNGLMTGQSGDWYAVFQGLGGAEIGYATIDDYADTSGIPVAVQLNDSVTLSAS